MTWTGPDSGGWYQATSFEKVGPPEEQVTYDYTYKFRYFSSTGVYEFKSDGTESGTHIGTHIVNATFHGTKDSDNLWAGDFTYTIDIGAITYKFEIDFSDLSDVVTSGIINGWFEATGTLTVANYQYAHYVFVYDPDTAEDPEYPCHLTGWHESSSNPIDMWVSGANIETE